MLLCAFALFSGSFGFAEDAPKFLGSQSCGTTGCHGGAGEKNRQFTVWSHYDVHHERPYATLTTARAERIAETLRIQHATESPRCTVCHAPMQTVPDNRWLSEGQTNIFSSSHQREITQGVSCENCHGPAENWIRSHTRGDYTHADRVHAGMRDLQNLYVRANTCVACHQNVDSDILAAGHPELIFELDGQAVTQPKHWRETTNFNGAQAWLVGQAVALREVYWKAIILKSSTEKDGLNLRALSWLLSKVRTSIPFKLERMDGFGEPADEMARQAAGIFKQSLLFDPLPPIWPNEWTSKLLTTLSGCANDFRDSAVPPPDQAYRAQRLVLGLDRLVTALPELDKNQPVQSALKQLFKDVQSLPDFKPTDFADHLAAFQKALPKD